MGISNLKLNAMEAVQDVLAVAMEGSKYLMILSFDLSRSIDPVDEDPASPAGQELIAVLILSQ